MWSEGALRAYGRYVDVPSYDRYTLEFDERFFDRVAGLNDRPILVGEYGYTVARRGLRAYRYPLADDEERAAWYRRYIETASAKDYVVGVFYYLMKDMELAGREGRFEKNMGFGFVNVADQFNEVYGNAAAEVNRLLYQLRKP